MAAQAPGPRMGLWLVGADTRLYETLQAAGHYAVAAASQAQLLIVGPGGSGQLTELLPGLDPNCIVLGTSLAGGLAELQAAQDAGHLVVLLTEIDPAAAETSYLVQAASPLALTIGELLAGECGCHSPLLFDATQAVPHGLLTELHTQARHYQAQRAVVMQAIEQLKRN